MSAIFFSSRETRQAINRSKSKVGISRDGTALYKDRLTISYWWPINDLNALSNIWYCSSLDKAKQSVVLSHCLDFISPWILNIILVPCWWLVVPSWSFYPDSSATYHNNSGLRAIIVLNNRLIIILIQLVQWWCTGNKSVHIKRFWIVCFTASGS